MLNAFYIKKYTELVLCKKRTSLLKAVDEDGKEFTIEGADLSDETRLVWLSVDEII